MRSYKELGIESQEIVPSGEAPIYFPRRLGAASSSAHLEVRPYRALQIQNLSDAICLPRQVIIYNNALVEDSFRRYNPTHKHVQLQGIKPGVYNLPRFRQEAIEIGGLCFFLDSEHGDHYGHLTLETLSRCWALEHLDVKELKIISSNRNLSVLAMLLQPFGVGAHQLVQFREQIRVRNLLVATQAYQLEQEANPALLSVWDTIGAYFNQSSKSARIYVSRSRWKKQRLLINEVEVENAFQDFGFEVVYPELLSLPEQISLFRHASLIAGPGGSNMYNLVYAASGTRAAILVSENFAPPNDAIICSLKDIHLTHFVGKTIDASTGGMFADWAVSIPDLRDFISEWVR